MGEVFKSKWDDWQPPESVSQEATLTSDIFFRTPLRPTDKTDKTPPDEWRQGVDALRTMRRPITIPSGAWQQILTNSTAFLTTWAAQARRLGWTATDLWGVHRAAPYHRLDCAGLTILQGDAKVRAMEAAVALIEKPSGAVLRFTLHRHDNPGCCLVWELDRDAAA